MNLNDSTKGRWLTPDLLGLPAQAGGDITNPQSLNRYAYALNNPTTLTDPSGLSCQDPTDGQPCIITVTAQAPPPIPPSQYPGCVAYGTEGCIQPPCGELPGVVGCGGIIYTTSYGASGGGSAHHIGFGILDTPSNLYPSASPQINCLGKGRGLSGNAALVGKQGGIPGQTVQLGTAAIIPQQFGVSSGAALAPYASNIWGMIEKAPFSAASDVVGGKSPIPGVPVRSALQQLFPGQLILEIPGAPDQGANAPVNISVPQTLGCPAGTSLPGGG